MKKIQEIDNFTHVVSLEQIKREIDYEFNLVCSKDALSELTRSLNVLEAKRASIYGMLNLKTSDQVFLNGTVEAKLIQPCSLTLEPLITNISKKILRTFSIRSNINKPTNKKVFELTKESFDNDIIFNEIDLGEVLIETISLETPDYPKKTGASLNRTQIKRTDLENPFSILSKLKK